MKNTRKAAAVWLAMSLAISTAFGNTAWGEIRPDTGNNRCVHVHTAECYKDADETATPSQIGKEPTECTHICSVESGCIRDTEKENNENADTLDAVASNTGKNDSKKEQAGEKAADRKDSSGNTDENKNLNDVPAQNGAALSVSTPSNAEDTTTTGGTVTPVSQTKILSWSWFDPEENLLDGRLELTGITEEAQPSFTEIIEYLPTAIIAQVGEGEDREEKNLLITNWSCPEYVQDEEGRWPLEGTYEFKAELPGGYELAEGVDALVVEVSVVGDQAAVTAETPLMTVVKDGTEKSIYWRENNYSVSDNELANMGIRLSYANECHYLTLKNVNMNSLYLGNWSNWVITLEGTNTLDVTTLRANGSYALMITEGTTVTIKGNGTLNARGRNTGSGINLGGTLIIESGTINASASKSLGEEDDGKTSGILIGSTGTLLVKGGDITASGTKAGGKIRYGMYVKGRFSMTGGEMKVIGNDCQGLYTSGYFELSGGDMAVSSEAGLLGFVANGNSTVINAPGTLTVDILDIAPGKTVTVKENATLTVDGVKLEKGSTLINNGNLTVNREVDDRDGGTLENNGTISGNGRIPDSAKQEPTKIADFEENIRDVYSENTSINVQKLANIQKPAKAGNLQYELVEYTGSESKGEGTIDESTGLLTVKKAGVFKIKVKTLASGIYQEGTPVEITLTVDKADFPNTWTVNVDAVSGVYNGTEGYPAATITSTRIPKDAEYKYQLAATSKSSNLPDQWQSECPKIVNVNESGQYVFVKVITDNYKSKVFCSNNTTHITQRSFTESVEVAIDSSVYNNKPQNPKIKVLENWKGTLGSELTEGIDYEISFWKKEDNNQSVTKLEDAGTYIVYLLGKGNYDGSLKTAAFTINKCKLKAQITGDSFDKVYDGTTDITEEQGLAIQLCDDNHKTPELQDVRADQIDWAYQSADVGEHDIDATISSLAGDQAKNYELTEQTISQKGTIKPRDFASMTVSAAPLTYNGTEQQPKINASVETGLENVSPDAVFTYSKDGVDYQSEIPGFTEAGTYLVYVKASMANFNDETKTVAVTVQKAAAPTVSAMSESYSYKETGERQVALPGFPENCGTIGSITAQIISDEGQILDSAAVDGMNLVLRLKGSSKNMVGKTAQVVVKVETKNYEDIQIPVIVTLTADSSDSNSNNNSGNNSGNNGSNNGNSNGSSSSDGDSSDYDDPNESSVKVTPDPSNKVTKDSQKGYRNVEQGVITGTANQTVNDGYSHWMKDAKGWWLRFSDGTWPMADRTGAYHWEHINGKWWAFNETGYAKTGWLRDEDYGGWFYMDLEHGMQTGWVLLDGAWYYFNPSSDGKRGIMYAGQRTPDGYYVDKNGVWDGRSKQ
ncbi:hypothetical protein [Pilosibacter fragilis]|uniref:hypothetical protein n=1 Tax=Pilosibacter fragilis TaxID=3078042 RepID=UPI0031BA3E71